MTRIQTLALGAVGSTLLFAQASCSSNKVFDRLDKDDNRKVSEIEFIVAVQRRAFDRLDADNDATISTDEWSTHETRRDSEVRFRTLDKNSDRRLTFSEFANLPQKKRSLGNLFGTLDRNDDGFLTPAELSERGL